MTITDTLDTDATIAQAIRMIAARCEYVRIPVAGNPGSRKPEEHKNRTFANLDIKHP